MESKASSCCLLLDKGAPVNADQAGLLSVELALVFLMWDGMIYVNSTAGRDKAFHYRVRHTVTKMKMSKCFSKACLEDSVPDDQMSFL